MPLEPAGSEEPTPGYLEVVLQEAHISDQDAMIEAVGKAKERARASKRGGAAAAVPTQGAPGELLEQLELFFFGEKQRGAVVKRFEALEEPLALGAPRPVSVDQRTKDICDRMKEKFPALMTGGIKESEAASQRQDDSDYSEF